LLFFLLIVSQATTNLKLVAFLHPDNLPLSWCILAESVLMVYLGTVYPVDPEDYSELPKTSGRKRFCTPEMWNLVCQAKPPDVDLAISRGNRTWSLLQNHNRRHSKELCVACGITIGELRTNNRHWALVDPKNPAGGVMCCYPCAWGHKPRDIPCPFPGCCREFRNLSHCNRHALTCMHRIHAPTMCSKNQGLRIFKGTTARKTPTSRTARYARCYYSCQSCGVIFVAKECLKVHKWIHESSKDWPYKCTEWLAIFLFTITYH
jgi:hypothetical protein